jgi:hypothetical protein
MAASETYYRFQAALASAGSFAVGAAMPLLGLDRGDRWSFFCVLDEPGQVMLERKLPTTPEAMKQTFGKIPQSLIALETGTHSPWVSRLLSELGHQVIVAHAQKVQLITKSNLLMEGLG